MKKLVGLLLVLTPLAAYAQAETFVVAIKEHRFQPAELTVPAGKKFQLVLDNQDATPEEFESRKLRVEKVIPGKSKATLTLGPLKPGAYPFVGEFHESTAKGTLHAK